MIAYNSEALQEVCHQNLVAVKLLGADGAGALTARFSDIQAANSVFDLPVGVCHIEQNMCEYAFKDILTVAMIPNYGPIAEDQIYDWRAVFRVKITRINDVT